MRHFSYEDYVALVRTHDEGHNELASSFLVQSRAALTIIDKLRTLNSSLPTSFEESLTTYHNLGTQILILQQTFMVPTFAVAQNVLRDSEETQKVILRTVQETLKTISADEFREVNKRLKQLSLDGPFKLEILGCLLRFEFEHTLKFKKLCKRMPYAIFV